MYKGLTRALGALLALVALYSLLGFLIVPGVALRIANQQLAQYATVPAHLQRTAPILRWAMRDGSAHRAKRRMGIE